MDNHYTNIKWMAIAILTQPQIDSSGEGAARVLFVIYYSH